MRGATDGIGGATIDKYRRSGRSRAALVLSWRRGGSGSLRVLRRL